MNSLFQVTSDVTHMLHNRNWTQCVMWNILYILSTGDACSVHLVCPSCLCSDSLQSTPSGPTLLVVVFQSLVLVIAFIREIFTFSRTKIISGCSI